MPIALETYQDDISPVSSIPENAKPSAPIKRSSSCSELPVIFLFADEAVEIRKVTIRLVPLTILPDERLYVSAM